MVLFVLNLLIVLAIAGANTICPNIYTREEWGAAPGSSVPLDIHPPGHVILHHSATPTCNSPVNCAAIVRSIQKHHMHRKNYTDIGYNFLVGEDGNVYEGVGWGMRGNHEERMNSRSLAICIIGDYTGWLPNDKAINAVQDLIDCGREQGYISQWYKIMAHKQLKHTDCPGTKLTWLVRKWRNWSAAP